MRVYTSVTLSSKGSWATYINRYSDSGNTTNPSHGHNPALNTELLNSISSNLSPNFSHSPLQVDCVKKRREKDGKVEYLVGWYGFDASSDTWEPEDHLSNCQDKVDDFLAKNKDKKIVSYP